MRSRSVPVTFTLAITTQSFMSPTGIVTCFASVGAKVLIADCDLNKAEELANRVSAHGGESLGPAQVDAMSCDVTDYAQVEACVDRAKELYGGLDIMVANAGLGQRPCRLEETSEEVYDQQFDVNMRGVFYCSKAVLPGFRAQGSGSIIITASGIALMPRPNLVIYGATKGAVLTFAKGLAMEVRPKASGSTRFARRRVTPPCWWSSWAARQARRPRTNSAKAFPSAASSRPRTWVGRRSIWQAIPRLARSPAPRWRSTGGARLEEAHLP